MHDDYRCCHACGQIVLSQTQQEALRAMLDNEARELERCKAEANRIMAAADLALVELNHEVALLREEVSQMREGGCQRVPAPTR